MIRGDVPIWRAYFEDFIDKNKKMMKTPFGPSKMFLISLPIVGLGIRYLVPMKELSKNEPYCNPSMLFPEEEH